MIASGPKRRASDGAADPSPVTTPLNPLSRTRLSRIEAKRGSSSTISTTESVEATLSRSSATASTGSSEKADGSSMGRDMAAAAARAAGLGAWAGLKFSGR